MSIDYVMKKGESQGRKSRVFPTPPAKNQCHTSGTCQKKCSGIAFFTKESKANHGAMGRILNRRDVYTN